MGFIQLQYCGCIIYAAQLRLLGQIVPSLNHFRWARKFIELANDCFKVQSEGSYKEKGSLFRPSFWIKFVCAKVETFCVLRARDWNPHSGAYTANNELGLLAEIIRLGELSTELEQAGGFKSITQDVAFCRKPLAYALSTIAHDIMQMSTPISRVEIDKCSHSA
jgi:hypothetical protein